MTDILTDAYQEDSVPDIICTGFDNAALGAEEALEESGTVPGTEDWPLISGTGCDAEGVRRIAEGKQAFSIFMDRRELADQCEDMVNVYLHGEDDPEVNDYEQYDNGTKIIGSYLCNIQAIDIDNYELLIDNGYYSEDEVRPLTTPVPTEKAISPTPTETAESVTPAPTETQDMLEGSAEADEETVTPTPEEKEENKVTSTPKPKVTLKKSSKIKK